VKKYNAWYSGERIGIFETLNDAQSCIHTHPNYKKSLFTKRGKASSSNSNQNESFFNF
jgi:hypothetical protein